MIRLLLCGLCLLGLVVPLRGQQLLSRARQASYHTTIYRLTDEQARFLYEHDLRGARPAFFRQPVDSFPTDSARQYQWRPLPPGYYLLARAEGPALVYWLRAETDRLVTVLDNQVDLTLLVRDSVGRLLGPAAQVQLARRPVPYDAATRTHRLAGAGPAGLVAVTYHGRTTYHPLNQTAPQRRESGPTGWPRWQQRLRGAPRWLWWRTQRLGYAFPLRYLTVPLTRLGQDLRHASEVSTGLVGLLRAPFSEDVRDERQERRADRRTTGQAEGDDDDYHYDLNHPTLAQRRRQRWSSYVAFSQPRYRPRGDTLRLKVRLLHRPDGHPRRGPLVLWLEGPHGKARRLAELRPVRPGSYQYTLPLTDSLGLRPDTYVQVRLATRRGLTLASGQFRLEDYELSSTRYTLRVGEKAHRRGAQQAIFLRGTDANDLSLLDARVQLSVTPSGVPAGFGGRQLFVPDTLWRHAGPLDAVGETRLPLPDSALPAAALSYQVRATFLNADHERHEETTQVPYLLDPGRLTLELADDSVRLRYLHLDQGRPHRARLTIEGGTDLESAPLHDGPVRLPLTLPVTPRARRYALRDSLGRSVELLLTAANAGLALRSDRTHDSIFLALENPRGLACWRFVYRANVLVHRSYGGPAWQLALPAPGPEAWHVSVHYFWAEELLSQNYDVALSQKQLRIAAEQPAVAYPGQRIELRYAVTDGGGRPLRGVDLTSYAHNGKFAQTTAPALPSYEPAVRGRISRRRFQLAADDLVNEPTETRALPLDWAFWRPRLGLDSLRFYQFLYPATGQFYEYRPAPGGLTQLAPFVVDSGRVQPPIAVYLDGVPVYVHDVNQDEPYSFVAEPGWHRLSVRTANRLVSFGEVYLRHLHKLTLSLDVNHPCRELTVENRPRFGADEQLGLARSLLLIDRASATPATATAPGTLLRQGNRLQPLRTSARDYHSLVGGPFRPDSVLLRHGSEVRRRAFVFEPLFQYTLQPGLLKMRCADPAAFGPLSGWGFRGPLPLDGFAYTEAMLRPARPSGVAAPAARNWIHDPYERPPVLNNPATTARGEGRLHLLLPEAPAGQRWERPLYLLVTRPDQPKFLRLAFGAGPAQGLPPGRYRVAVLLADSTCWAPKELVSLRPNGTTYLQLSALDLQQPGPLSRRIGRLVRQRVPALPVPATPAPVRRQIQVTRPAAAAADWPVIQGKVTDRATGEGLPGVTILVRGTTVGISTNADGTFALAVPPTADSLDVSFVGFRHTQCAIRGAYLEISLAANNQELSEVVVTGYGVEMKRSNLTASVTNVTASLQGRAAGVAIRGGAPGGGVRLTIRGTGSVASSGQPLIILDGLPFQGRIEDIDQGTIAGMKVLKGAEATGLYGSAAANGVVIISTKNGPNGLSGAQPGLPGAAEGQGRGLRRRFRDYGWWQPTLVTDARGHARASVVLPDDVTSWDAFVLGSDAHGRTGSLTTRLRAFKALRAELAVPRFLVAGDRAQVIGKTLSYLPDTAAVTTSFRVGAAELRRQVHRVRGAALDTLTVQAPATPGDSLLLTFGLAQPNGYQDGEQRPIPVLPAGTVERSGHYLPLTAADTTLTLPPFDPRKGPVTLRLETDPVPALLSEIEHVRAYAYLCNEQAASKLKALLLERRIRAAMGEKFGGDRAVNYLIRKLLAGRYPRTPLWGTWPTSAVSYWASTHVLEALLAAQEAGYPVALDRAPLLAYLAQTLDEELARAEAEARRPGGPSYYHGYGYQTDNLLRVLRLLRQLGGATAFETYLNRLARLQRGPQPLDRYLAFTELRQELKLPYQLDTLRRYRLRTQLGGVYYADTLHANGYYQHLLSGAVGSTLLAYRMLRREGGHEAELLRLRVYLLGLRRTGHWRSTYEAAQILETIGPDLFAPGRATVAARVTLGGGLPPQELPAAQLPFQTELPATAAPLTLRKEGLQPVYATAYQSYWNPAPEARAGDFAVTTTLAGQTGRQVRLRAGQPAELLVTVDVKAAARYVLVEVPIPAGCSYGPHAPANPHEVHREYLRHQVGIFLDDLPVGRHTFRISLQPRYRGRYTLNPARAELVYFPTRFGRSASKQAVVQ